MAEEQEILDAPEADEQDGGPGPQPALSEENRKKLDTIVGQMSANKETDDAIKTVVEDFKKKYSAPSVSLPKLDYRKPIQQSTVTENKGQVAPQNVPTVTNDQQLIKRHGQAITTLDNELQGNNDLIPGLIKSQKVKNEQTAGAAQFAQQPRSDAPLTSVQQLGLSLQPKPQEPEVSDKDVSDFMQNIQYNPEAGKAFLQHVAAAKPDKAKAIQEASYTNDAMNRLSQDPNGTQKGNKVIQNAQKIAKGDLHYDVQSGALVKPEDTWESIGTALKEKKKAFADYDLFNKATTDVAIQELEKRRAEHDPDEPIPIPKGFMAELSGGMAGQPLRGLVAGKVVGGATALIPGAEEFAPAVDKFVAAAQSGDDYRKISYAHSLQQNYNQLRNDGVTPELAYAQADDVAKKESLVDAASGAAMMYGAGAIGEMKLPSFASPNGFKGAVVNALKQGAKGVGEAGAVGLIQGAAQQVKNDIKDDAGITRDYTGGDIKEATESGALFTLGMAVLAKGGSMLSKKTRTEVLQGLSKATPEQVQQELGNQIIEKHITPEEAVKTEQQINEHRELDESVPPNITSENRMKILDKIDRRKELESELETKDKAYHPEIKEKIKAINEDILELSSSKTPKGEQPEITPPEQPSESEVEKPTEGAGTNEPEGAASSISAGDVIISKHLDGPQQVRSVSEDGKTVFVEGAQYHHVHEIPLEEVTLRVKKNAGSTPESQDMPQDQDPTDNQVNATQIPTEPQPVSEQSPDTKSVSQTAEPEMTGITHAQTDEVARQLGLDTYEQKPETVAEWDAEADKRLREDPQTIPKLLKKLEEGHEPDKIDQRVMVRHLSSLKARIEDNPTDALLAEYKRAKDLSDIMGGREVAKSLAARRGSVPIKDSLADYMTEEMDASGVDELTPEQKKQNQKEYDDISKAQADYDKRIKDLEEENAKFKAEAEVKKTAKGSKKSVKKSSADYAKERKDILAEMRADLLKAAKGQGGLTASVPGAAQLAAIAPHVAKLVKSLVEEGYDKLGDIVKNIHGELKDVVDGITEKDVHDIIAGEHNEKKATKNDLAAKLKDLRDEAALINKLERLKNGIEPKSEKKKVERNKEITALKKQISDLIKQRRGDEKEGNAFYTDDKDTTARKLESMKARNDKETKEVNEKISKGDYGPDEKKTPLLENPEVQKKYPSLFKEAKESRDKLVAAKQEREVRLLKQQYAQRSKIRKTLDVVAEIGNTPRALMSSLDFSAPLRQGLFGVTKQLVSHPGDLGRQFAFMFKAAKSQKIFDRWFQDLKEAPDYQIMGKSGLPLSDPHDPKLTAKEEAFMSNYAEKIPVVGKLIKASENAYVGFLNKMRVDIFRRATDGFAANGKTFQNSPELYKALGDYVGAATGRGSMPEMLEESSPILSAAFFSPRLIASRLNLLTNWANPKFYNKIPKEIRVQYFKDMFKFIGTGALLLGVAKMGGAEVETDPTSSDFGKIKSGNTRWDIWGGFQQYVRLAAQLAYGEQKSTTTGKVTELNDPNNSRSKTRYDVLLTFARGKLAPIPAETVDLLAGKDVTGKPATIGSEAMKNLPLVLGDIKSAFDDKGIQGALLVGLPSMFGVGTQTYGDDSGGKTGGGGAGGSYEIKQWK